MGEYAIYNGESVKIGTCEDMYYLRADQRHLVHRDSGSLDPMHEGDTGAIRFRFPFPDEDDVAPGCFDAYDRGLDLDVAPPLDVTHRSEELTCRPGGPGCRQSLKQQKFFEGHLIIVCKCLGCGELYRVETAESAAPFIAECRRLSQVLIARGDDGRALFFSKVADRIENGYGPDPFAWTGIPQPVPPPVPKPVLVSVPPPEPVPDITLYVVMYEPKSGKGQVAIGPFMTKAQASKYIDRADIPPSKRLWIQAVLRSDE